MTLTESPRLNRRMSAMRRVWRYLREPGDASLVRSWSAIVLGASLVGLPVTFGMLELRTCLIASLVGAILSLVFSRLILGSSLWILDRMSGIAFVAFLALFALAAVASAQSLESPAGFCFLGAFVLAHGVTRLLIGYRDPPNTSTWG